MSVNYTRFVSKAGLFLVELIVLFSLAAAGFAPATVYAAGETGAAQAPQNASSGAIVVASVNTNCRSGPSTAFSIVGYLAAGQSAPAVGRNSDDSWWQIQNPNQGGMTCWVWGGSTQLQGNASALAMSGGYFAPYYSTAPNYYMAPYYGYNAPYFRNSDRFFFRNLRRFCRTHKCKF